MRHFDSGGLEGRKARPFCTFCLAALTIYANPYEIVAYVDRGEQSKALPAGWAALFPFRLSSGKPVLFLLWLTALIFNFLQEIHHSRMAIKWHRYPWCIVAFQTPGSLGRYPPIPN